jgi:hypothetical protein
MRRPKTSRVLLLVSGLPALWTLAVAAQQPSVLPMSPFRERGASVTPAYEGWYRNDDGSFSLLVGYYNRNSKEPLEIPIGQNNKIEPGEADQGQPTHFEVGRQWGVFVIKVPKDFGNKTIRWVITANGETQSIPFTLNPGYPITPFQESGMGNRPPVLSFTQGGPKFTGPPVGFAATLNGTIQQPVPLSVWVEDPKNEKEGGERGRGTTSGIASLSFHKYRGPGEVKFDKTRASAAKQGDTVSASASFAMPGEYWLRVQANDESGEGGGGFQCCWTNTYVKVVVK